MSRKFKLWGLRSAAGIVIVAVVLASYAGFLQLTGNFHIVVPSEFYRSAQPKGSDLVDYHNHYKIKTIINLRGEKPGKEWYDAEIAEAKRLGIAHIDFRMSASRELSLAKAKELITVFQEAQKPILVHCKSGSDRTGLASALYLAAISASGEAAAEKQISFRFGHVSLPGTAAYPMDVSWEKLEPWLGFKGS